MKETVVLEAINEEKIVLPISYNHIVQGMIYETWIKNWVIFFIMRAFKKIRGHIKCLHFQG